MITFVLIALIVQLGLFMKSVESLNLMTGDYYGFGSTVSAQGEGNLLNSNMSPQFVNFTLAPNGGFLSCTGASCILGIGGSRYLILKHA